MLTKPEFDILKYLEKHSDSAILTMDALAGKLKMDCTSVVETYGILSDKKYVAEGRITASGIEALKPYKV